MRSIILIAILFNIGFSALLKPVNNSTLNQTHILFEWEQELNNAFYVLDIAENSNDIDNNCIICDQYIQNSLIHIQTELLEWNKTYYWKIVAYNNDNEANIIGTSSFSISSPIANATADV